MGKIILIYFWCSLKFYFLILNYYYFFFDVDATNIDSIANLNLMKLLYGDTREFWVSLFKSSLYFCVCVCVIYIYIPIKIIKIFLYQKITNTRKIKIIFVLVSFLCVLLEFFKLGLFHLIYFFCSFFNALSIESNSNILFY